MLIIPDLLGMARSVLIVLNQRDEHWLCGRRVGWGGVGGAGPWSVLIWLPGPDNTSAALAGLAASLPEHHR